MCTYLQANQFFLYFTSLNSLLMMMNQGTKMGYTMGDAQTSTAEHRCLLESHIQSRYFL